MIYDYDEDIEKMRIVEVEKLTGSDPRNMNRMFLRLVLDSTCSISLKIDILFAD